MEHSIFRKKSLERVISPEQLSDCIRVSTSGVWLVLIALVLVLAGLCVWSVFGRIPTRVEQSALAENGELTVLVPAKYESRLGETTSIECEGTRYENLRAEPGANEAGDVILRVETELPDGEYEAVVTVDDVHPIFFIVN